MFCPALSSFPKSVSKISASASKAAPSQVADIEHATRGAQPEACFDPLVTKAVAFIAASSCTPNELLWHSFVVNLQNHSGLSISERHEKLFGLDIGKPYATHPQILKEFPFLVFPVLF